MADLILYDGECALCNRSVRFLIEADKRGHFLYAPLQGETASHLEGAPFPLDTLILIEGFQTKSPRIWKYGRGVLRICWRLGGWYRLIGLLSFLPGWLADPLYRLVARNRHTLFRGGAGDLKSDRILP